MADDGCGRPQTKVNLRMGHGWKGNNLSGFDPVTGGFRGDGGTFGGIGTGCNFRTASLYSQNLSRNRPLSFNNNGVSRFGLKPTFGSSIRCLKDE
jgi:uncharacterized protein YjbI with pentapeptide repeats